MQTVSFVFKGTNPQYDEESLRARMKEEVPNHEEFTDGPHVTTTVNRHDSRDVTTYVSFRYDDGGATGTTYEIPVAG